MIKKEKFEETLEEIICFWEANTGEGEPREIIEKYLKENLKK